MSKVLFMNGPSQGHINPTIPLMEELIKRGEQITCFITEEYREKIERTGATFRACDNYLKKYYKPEHKIGLFEGIEGLLNIRYMVIHDVLRQIKDEKFDYVIHDSILGCGSDIAQILKLPAVCSCTTLAPSKKRVIIPDMSGFGLFKNKVTGYSHYRNSWRTQKEQEELFGLKPSSPLDAYFRRGDLNIVYTSREFQPYSSDFDNSFKFVGPSISDRKENIEFPFEVLKGKKVIYISMGTVHNYRLDFYKICMDAFRGMDVQVVLSIGDTNNIENLKNIPDNFIVRNYVPQIEILKHTDVFISHGGMNSTSEAIFSNVPLVLVPMAADQFLVAKRVEELKLGICLNKDKITSELLKKTVSKVLSNMEFVVRTKRIGETLRRAGGYKKAVDEIFEFKAEHNISNKNVKTFA